MRKNLLSIAFLGVCVFSNAQLLYMKNSANFNVQNNALVYCGGGVQLDDTSRLNLIGDFMIDTSTGSFVTASGADFRLRYVDSNTYGQLYVRNMPQANLNTGKVNKEYVSGIHGTTARQQVALPFNDYTIHSLYSTIPHINAVNTDFSTKGRWNKSSVFKWNNSLAVFDQIVVANSPTRVGLATDYYILPRLNANLSEAWDTTITTENPNAVLQGFSGTVRETKNTMKKIFSGIPVSDQNTTNVQVTLTNAFNGSYGTNGNGTNKYNEKYYSYIDDPFVVTKWSTNYGKYVYQHGNPFLTNVDLSYIKKGTTSTDDDNYISNLQGIFYYTSGLLNSTSGTTYTSATGVKITFDTNGNPVGGSGAGNTYVNTDLIIKPMQEIMIKLNDNSSPADPNERVLKFNKTRRFAQTARTSATYSPTSARISSTAKSFATYSVTSSDADYSSAASGKMAKTSTLTTKQLNVLLYDVNDNLIGKTFYVVNADAVTGYQPDLALMQAIADDNTIYTKEELSSGGADASVTYTLHINEANENDYAGKEISLVVNNPIATKLKFLLVEDGKYIEEGQSLTSGKSFYFSNNGTLTKLNSGTTLDLANTNYTYGLYYDQPSGTLGTSELLNGQTIVAKKESGYIVRFNKNWKQADIEVYSATGQLIHSAKKVSTNSDYQLPIDNTVNAVYIVKVKSENGEVVTKKIIK